MNRTAYQTQIASSLQTVSAQRERCAREPDFALHLARLKRYQAGRLKDTYADLHVQPRYSAAVDFFTEDLYGDQDFSARDTDLQRIVPAVAKLFPLEALATLSAALRLHALSETLDTQMCEIHAGAWREQAYARAWRQMGQQALRQEQLTLVLQVGQALDKLVKLPMIGMTLKAMSGPAAAAGLSELHDFLSRGYKAFKALKGAGGFLDIIHEREQGLMDELFNNAR